MCPGPVATSVHSGDLAVPSRKLRNGDLLPAIGMGTFGSDRYGPAAVSQAVHGALQVGYRLIDCAAVYGNESDIGEVLQLATTTGIERSELFVMSKLWNDSHGAAGVARSIRTTLHDLRLDHLDAYFVHWPFPNHHSPGADSDERDPDARPYLHDEFMATWQAMEELVDQGLVRHLGTSNVTVPKLSLILRDARIPPSLNEMELHPCFQQPELFDLCVGHDIQPVGYSPLGSPSRPERDRTETDPIDVRHPAVLAVAEARGVHPALVCLMWAVTRGQIPIPFAVKPEQYGGNLRAASTTLTPAEMELLSSADSGARLIKGQVFLWPGATSWQDLWDLDGTVPGWEGTNPQPKERDLE